MSQPVYSFSVSLDANNDRIHEPLLIGQHTLAHKKADSEKLKPGREDYAFQRPSELDLYHLYSVLFLETFGTNTGKLLICYNSKI